MDRITTSDDTTSKTLLGCKASCQNKCDVAGQTIHLARALLPLHVYLYRAKKDSQSLVPASLVSNIIVWATVCPPSPSGTPITALLCVLDNEATRVTPIVSSKERDTQHCCACSVPHVFASQTILLARQMEGRGRPNYIGDRTLGQSWFPVKILWSPLIQTFVQKSNSSSNSRLGCTLFFFNSKLTTD